MTLNNHYLPEEIYLRYLEAIEEFKFSRREIDVISCLVKGRSTKKISSILSISPKTVTTHIRNIMLKLDVNSREGILDFFEKHDKNKNLQEYYEALMVYANFQNKLKKISNLNKQENMHFFLLCSNVKENNNSLVGFLRNNLNIFGIHVYCDAKDGNEEEYVKRQDLKSISHFIYVVKPNANDIQQPNYKTKFPNKSHIFLLEDNDSPKGSGQEDECIILSEKENYYFLFLDLLKKIFPDLDFEEITANFKSNYKKTGSSPMEIEQPQTLWKIDAVQPPILREKKKNRFFLASAVSCSCILFLISLVSYKTLHSKTVLDEDNDSIRSDILLPNEKVLLARAKLWDQLEDKLKATQVALLTGIGGAGKTTLARQYAQRQKANIVWEINAETKSSLLDSFKSLAYRMAKTEDQKNELNFIQIIQDPVEKERQLLYFIKKNMKKSSNWILVYDNVDKFSDVKSYFPRDFINWGTGKVILTTRDDNIGKTIYFNPYQVIHIEKLSPLETLSLFSKILYDCEPNDLSSPQQEAILEFLKNIPPFPLDVSAAAYYIKNTGVTYVEYLENINKANENFNLIQEKLLTEISDYTKTRYSIITISFKKLMEMHPEFKELLFLICLLDSQNIPKSFMEFYKGQSAVDSFIRGLQKYSLLTNESKNKGDKFPAFSLHRSTQALGKAFLLNMLGEMEIQDFLARAISSAKSFYGMYSEKDYNFIIPLIPHLEMLLNNLKSISLSENIKNKYELDLCFVLGYSYFRGFRSYIYAKKYFSRIFEISENNQHFSNITLAILLKDFGEVSISLNDLNQPYSERSLNLCKDIKNAEMIIAENLQTIGDSHRKQDNFKEANLYLKKALNEISHLDKKARQILESKIYDRLGWLYSVNYIHKSEAQQAKEYLSKSLEVLNAPQTFHSNPLNKPKNKLPCFVANHRLRLGVINTRLGNYKEAVSQGFQEAQYILDHSLDSCPHDVFLQSRISEAVGEMLLREGKIDQAEKKLSEAIKVIETIVGKSITQTPKSFRAEARIRQGKLSEAYEDCLFVLQITTREKNNFHNLLYLTNHYNAAIVKYKQKDFKKSREHFIDFFREIKKFCATFLHEKTYKDLEYQGTFSVGSDNQEDVSKVVIDCLDKSQKIFAAIYGPAHPFVTDYVMKCKAL